MRRLVPFVAACGVIGGGTWLFAQSAAPPTPTPSIIPVFRDCAVSGTGVFTDRVPGGDVMFEGSASTVGGIFRVRWEHTAPGITFTTDIADGVNCFTNGGLIAVVDGFGVGTLNGVPGYYYTIFAEDRRPPGQPAVTLTASRTSPPTRWVDGEATFSPPRQVTIPETLEVVEGDPGGGWARLYLGDVTCDYRGDGTVYAFERCPGSPGLGPGATFEVRSARLRVRTGGSNTEPTIVARATIAPAVPAARAPDIYSVTVFDATGTIIYDFGANLNDGEGDIVVNFLP